MPEFFAMTIASLSKQELGPECPPTGKRYYIVGITNSAWCVSGQRAVIVFRRV
jgi:hypothetical protein